MTTDRSGTRKASVLPSCRCPDGPTTDRAGRAALLTLGAILSLLLALLMVLES
jgi:hypothetical protein